MSIDLWYPILGWEHLPNFGNCHTVQDLAEFGKNYKETYDIARFRKNILETLTGQFEQINIRILGNPGSGKTSFIYSLIKNYQQNSNDGKLLAKYHFYIFHVNRAAGINPDEIVQAAILDAWNSYYLAVKQEGIFESIQNQKVSIKEKLNLLTDFFKRNRDKFSEKILVFVIEDGDLLPPEELKAVTESIIKHIELSSTKKWLVLRGETYEKYNDDIRRKIDSFFPDLRLFPRLSLYDIISHRIIHTSGGKHPKNPFTSALCERILKLFDGNLREALSALQSILADISPGKITSTTSVEFIQEYIDQASISSLTRSGHLYNIHLQHLRNVPYPIPLDTICLMRFINDATMLSDTVSDAMNYRWEKVKPKDEDRHLIIRKEMVSYTLKQLVQYGLATFKQNSYTLTLNRPGF
jgi:hypothetical protein